MFRCVASAFAVFTFASPFCFSHQIKYLRGRCPRGAKCFKRWFDLSLIVFKAYGEFFLIVTLNQWSIFSQQATQSDSRSALAISKVMHYFAGAPFSRQRMRRQKLGWKILQ